MRGVFLLEAISLLTFSPVHTVTQSQDSPNLRRKTMRCCCLPPRRHHLQPGVVRAQHADADRARVEPPSHGAPKSGAAACSSSAEAHGKRSSYADVEAQHEKLGQVAVSAAAVYTTAAASVLRATGFADDDDHGCTVYGHDATGRESLFAVCLIEGWMSVETGFHSQLFLSHARACGRCASVRNVRKPTCANLEKSIEN